MELSLSIPDTYQVKSGQTVACIARTFSVPPSVLVKYNNLTEEVQAGQILKIPRERYNLYVVRGGESKSLLCGSPDRFLKINRTSAFYPAQIVFLG